MGQDPNFFPIMVRLEGKKCLVVGAGKVAAGKISGLLAYGAQVVVVSPRAMRPIQRLAQSEMITLRRRAFSPKDVEGKFLVVSAANSTVVNKAVFRACKARGVLCNAVDDPERCDFYYPAVVHRGPLQIAISTNGQSPALAARLRRELETQFGPEWGAWVQEVGQARRQVLSQNMSAKARRKALLKMSRPEAFNDFARREDGRSSRKSGKTKRAEVNWQKRTGKRSGPS